ncbi:RCC1 domain-containing protein [Nocardioides gilvus]|uniref:RCC1 domain-containing protein n=1 Tax=Nocardioides gilvus TaxID=1735589 RepID=UPI0013A5403E|nr:hypothetical protein [Nocardioides gilvus]
MLGGTGLSRRTVMAGAAWSGPVIVVATSAPAFAVSSTKSLTATAPVSGDVFWGMAASTRVFGTAVFEDGAPVAGAEVTFTLSDSTWLTSVPLNVTTDGTGLAVATLTAVSGVLPAPGAMTVLTATHGDLTVTWTLSYRPFTALATGCMARHALAVADGKVYSWGQNSSGKLGDGTITTKAAPVATVPGAIPSTVKITAVATGGTHSLALGDDGRVYAWGSNVSGQLGNDSTATSSLTPVATVLGATPPAVKITAIAAGANHSLALGDDGNVYAWGDNTHGRLGDDTTAKRLTPVATLRGAIPSTVTINAIAAGETHSLALGDDGNVYAWGNNLAGQLGTGTTRVPAAASRGVIPVTVTITAITATLTNSYALTSQGLAYAWGSRLTGQLGNGTLNGSVSSPVQVTLTPLP